MTSRRIRGISGYAPAQKVGVESTGRQAFGAGLLDPCPVCYGIRAQTFLDDSHGGSYSVGAITGVGPDGWDACQVRSGAVQAISMSGGNPWR